MQYEQANFDEEKKLMIIYLCIYQYLNPIHVLYKWLFTLVVKYVFTMVKQYVWALNK